MSAAGVLVSSESHEFGEHGGAVRRIFATGVVAGGGNRRFQISFAIQPNQ